MKLIISNISLNKEYEMDLSSNKITIKELKQELDKNYNLSLSSKKISFIFKGQALSDDSRSLEDYKIEDNSKIILKIEDDSNKNNNKKNNDLIDKEETKYKNQLNTLLEMGFEKEKAISCINAARGRTELAIEYYYNEIPNLDEGEDGENESDEAVESDNDNDNTGNIDNLLEKTAGVVKIICKEKEMRHNDVLQLIKTKNPYLFQLIKDNQDDFNNYLSTPISNKDLQAFDEFKNLRQGGSLYNLSYKDFYQGDYEEHEYSGSQEEGEGDDDQDDGVITDKDKEILKRLKDLGDFKEDEILEAYINCGRNEELTADYLFEKMEQNDDQDNNQNQGGVHPLDDDNNNGGDL